MLGPRSTVLILSDARNNARTARRALAVIGERSRKVFWLNPESRERWDTGTASSALTPALRRGPGVQEPQATGRFRLQEGLNRSRPEGRRRPPDALTGLRHLFALGIPLLWFALTPVEPSLTSW